MSKEINVSYGYGENKKIYLCGIQSIGIDCSQPSIFLQSLDARIESRENWTW